MSVGNLVFRADQLVRLGLASSDVAAEEACFVEVLNKFLTKATAEREAVAARAEAVQVTTSHSPPPALRSSPKCVLEPF